MKPRRRFAVVMLGLVGALLSPAAAFAQALVVTTRSPNDLADAVETLIKSAALEDEPIGQTILGAVNRVKMGAILKGLDRSRGFSMAVSFPKNFPDGGPPTAVLAVPVSDFGALLESVKELGLAVDDQPGVPGFSHKVVGPNGQPTLFVLQSKEYALCTPIPAQAETLRGIDPTAWWPKGRTEKALRLVIRLAEMPEPIKQQFLDNMKAQNARERERRPGEIEGNYRGRVAGIDLAQKLFELVVQQGKEIGLEIDVDKKASQLTLEAALSALPNSSMETTLRTLNGRRSQFHALGQASVAAEWGCFSIPAEFKDVLLVGFNQQVSASAEKAPSADEKKLFKRTIELFTAVLNQPVLDAGVALRQIKAAGDGNFQSVLLIGWKVPSGKDFDDHLRSTSVVAKPTDKLKLTFDVSKGPRGEPIHQLSGKFQDNDADLVKRFGNASLYMTARDDAILLSFGESGLQVLQDALAKLSAPSAPASAAPMTAIAHLADLAVVADGQNDAVKRIISQVYPGQSAKRDRIAIDVKGDGEATVLHIAVDLPAIGFARQIAPLLQK